MNVLRILAEFRTPFLDQVFQFITYFGQEIVLIAVICLLYWCIDKRFAYLLGFVYFFSGLFVQSLKITFRIDRPWVLDPDFQPVASAKPGATGYSFPSGHTQGGTSLFAPLAKKTDRNGLKVLYIGAFVLIGFSRLYLGVHTPKDVLVSMGLSLLFTTVFWRIQNALLDSDRYLRPVTVIMILLSIAVCIYANVLYTNQIIDAKYASDCFKAAGSGLGFAIGFYIERTWLNFDPECRNNYMQIPKVLCGLLGAGLIKSCFFMIVPSTLFTRMIQYLLLVLWVLVLYPFIFSKCSNAIASR